MLLNTIGLHASLWLGEYAAVRYAAEEIPKIGSRTRPDSSQPVAHKSFINRQPLVPDNGRYSGQKSLWPPPRTGGLVARPGVAAQAVCACLIDRTSRLPGKQEVGSPGADALNQNQVWSRNPVHLETLVHGATSVGVTGNLQQEWIVYLHGSSMFPT
ncbi:hypothetical protein NUW58_g1983 [Xylaria curta]|uniref:Uncharacterized protein n=1 Tax=Xylaria curta TaxID=42375 RepID=A0ACC1PL04_9PEZI|nr:hypothetical protein NUW58_g1983 [Xylaria curta]